MEVWEKSETVDPEVRAYVYSLVNAVGGQSTLDDRYAVGDDALAVLNDLLRWLRLYDEKTNRFDVKRCLAEANLVKGDLLEILALWPEDAQDNKLKSKLALACLQLMVPLTWPIELDEEKTTVNHLRHTPYIKLAQVGYKRAILHFEDASILRTAVRIGLPSMATERRERTRRDEGIIKMMLYLFRNMAMITQPRDLPSQGDENEISRSATIEAFQEQDIFSLLLTVGSGTGDEFQEQDVIILETLFHLLKGVDPKRLFMLKEQLATEETNELAELVQKEQAMLNRYKKHAPSRHNRFGTMIWVKRDDQKMSTVTGQNTIANESDTLHQMDSTKKWDKPKYRGKLVHDFSDTSDFGMRVDLTENARKHLRTFVEDFLDSSFNPLFASLRKAIEREVDRVGRTNRRQFFYLINWFLQAEASRRHQIRSTSGWHADRQSQPNAEDNTFAHIAAVLDQETFVLLSRQMQEAFDSKQWQDLQSTLLCFTQILLTVQSMSESPDEEDQEIAENIQSRIFYEEVTHDLMVQILRGFTHQGFAYLDAITECVHVFVRMLERYSKQNVDLQIRSKRKARKKQKKQAIESGEAQNDDNEDALEAAADEQEAYTTARERKFDFARFSAKFMSQPCVNTFIALLHFYADLSPAQMKRCHRYLYRLAFKNELAVLLFRVDILQLLHRMIKGPQGLDPATEAFKDWEMLVQQIFRRCIKWIERDSEGEGWKEAMVVEMLFSKIPNTLFYLQNGYERVIEKRPPRPPADLEVKASVDEGQRVGVAVSVLLEQGKQDAVEWIKGELKRAVNERQAWDDEQAARSLIEKGLEDGEQEDMPGARLPAPTIFVGPDNDVRKEAMFKDKYLRLLLTTLGLERLGATEDPEASWTIPSELTPTQLKEALDQIQKAEFDGLSLEGQSAQDLIRNKSASRRSAAEFSDDGSGSDGDGDVDAAMFPPNLREKRKNSDDADLPKKKRRLTRRNQTELTEEQLQERADERKRRERERNTKIKPQLFITESDEEEDAEADAEFFRLEAERRRKMDGIIRSTLRKEAKKGDGGEEGGKKKDVSKKKRKRADEWPEEEGQIGSNLDSSEDSEAPGPRDPSRGMSTDSEPSDDEVNVPSSDEEEARPRKPSNSDAEATSLSTSPPAIGKPSADLMPLGEVSGNAAGLDTAVKGAEMEIDENEDDEPIMKPAVQMRNVRAGFIIDDDSDDE